VPAAELASRAAGQACGRHPAAGLARAGKPACWGWHAGLLGLARRPAGLANRPAAG